MELYGRNCGAISARPRLRRVNRYALSVENLPFLLPASFLRTHNSPWMFPPAGPGGPCVYRYISRNANASKRRFFNEFFTTILIVKFHRRVTCNMFRQLSTPSLS